MIKQVIVTALSAGIALGWAGTAQASCAIVTVKAEPDLNYDPFGGRGGQDKLELLINRSGCRDREDQTAPIEIWFADDRHPSGGERRVGGVPIEIRAQGVNYLARGGSSSSGGVLSVGGSGERVVHFDVVTQPDEPGAFDQEREISVYYRSVGHQGQALRLPVRLRLRLLPKFDLSANGSGTAGMNFGTIEPGEEMALILRARGTQPFKIEMRSLYASHLRRVRVCGAPVSANDPLETIAYATSIGGQPVSPNADFTDRSVEAGKLFEQRLPLSVKVDPAFSSQRKRAGDYCDVISLRIVPR